VTDYLKCGDLGNILKSPVELSWCRRLKIALGIARGLAHLHANEIQHRDVKSDNVLVAESSWNAVLCDYGTVRLSITAGPLAAAFAPAPTYTTLAQ
jgi:serine/threonine protein kinase